MRKGINFYSVPANFPHKKKKETKLEMAHARCTLWFWGFKLAKGLHIYKAGDKISTRRLIF